MKHIHYRAYVVLVLPTRIVKSTGFAGPRSVLEIWDHRSFSPTECTNQAWVAQRSLWEHMCRLFIWHPHIPRNDLLDGAAGWRGQRVQYRQAVTLL